MLTYSDLIEHATDFLGGSPSDAVQRDAKRAVLEAVRDLSNARRWTYFLTHGRIVTSGPYSDGSVAYDHTGGAAERMVTLTGGTWPAWAGQGAYLRVGYQAWKVAARLSGTTLQLDELVNPGMDVTGGTAYQLYRDSYLLPEDFIASDQALYERNFGGMTYVHPREWLFDERFLFAEGTPMEYTITGDRVFAGRLVMRVAPLPVEAKTIDFLYDRRPRPLRIAESAAGTVSVAADATTVTGVGTAFAPGMVGSILRVSGSPLLAPTSEVGENPPIFETVVTGYTSATSIAVKDPCPADLSAEGYRYTISDPVDIEPGAMMNALLRGVERQIAVARQHKEKDSIEAAYLRALEVARGADTRTFSGRYVGDGARPRQRLRDMPISFADTSN